MSLHPECAVNYIKGFSRCTIHASTMNDCLMVLLNGPLLRHWDPRPSAELWYVAGKRRSREVGHKLKRADKGKKPAPRLKVMDPSKVIPGVCARLGDWIPTKLPPPAPLLIRTDDAYSKQDELKTAREHPTPHPGRKGGGGGRKGGGGGKGTA